MDFLRFINKDLLTVFFVDSDVGDLKLMLATESRSWLYLLSVGARRQCKKIVYVGDQTTVS